MARVLERFVKKGKTYIYIFSLPTFHLFNRTHLVFHLVYSAGCTIMRILRTEHTHEFCPGMDAI